MTAVHFTNLLIVVAHGLFAALLPRFRLPAIVLGIVIGPSGLEIDLRRLRGQSLKLTALGFVVSFVIAIVVGLGLHAGGFVKSPLFVAIVLVATSLG